MEVGNVDITILVVKITMTTIYSTVETSGTYNSSSNLYLEIYRLHEFVTQFSDQIWAESLANKRLRGNRNQKNTSYSEFDFGNPIQNSQ
jgi:hypothetical protein